MKWILCLLLCLPLIGGAETVVVGSKKFTESYVLAEITKKTLEDAGFTVEHRQGIGATGIVWAALKGGSIDLYPEYTGTISEEILKSKTPLTADQMRAELAKQGIGMTGELGFNDGYALAMRKDQADKLGIRTVGDLKSHPDLRLGMTHEFLDRQDGWKMLSKKYGLNMTNVSGIDHSLGYEALINDKIDLKDVYTTDAEIGENHLQTLQDDQHFFPLYKAVFLYRLSLNPKALAAVRKLENTINEDKMIALNSEAKRTKDYTLAASSYFGASAHKEAASKTNSAAAYIAHLVARHLMLVGISLLFAVLVGIPLGIVASKPGILSQFILGAVGVIQTIPSLALLALLVPLFGISPLTAIIALFLYSLLPIVRNTAVGIQDIPQSLRESAEALGLASTARLTKIYLPMASRSILAGIKTSAVINVGTATLAALIGGGGLGEPIVSGLSLLDNNRILQGAIPAAVLALLVQFAFDLLDRVLIPKGLRLQAREN